MLNQIKVNLISHDQKSRWNWTTEKKHTQSDYDRIYTSEMKWLINLSMCVSLDKYVIYVSD